MMSWYSIQQNAVSYYWNHAYVIVDTIALHFLVLFCLLVHIQFHRNRQLDLGRNYSGILYGLSLMITLQSLNYALRLFEYVPHQSFIIYVQALGFIPWIAYAFCMRRLDLPKPLEPELVNELAAVEANLRRAVSSVR